MTYNVFSWTLNPTHFTSALPEFNQLLHFFNLFDSRLILTPLYDFLNLVINAFSYRDYWGMVQEKGSRERCSSWTVVQAQCTSALCSAFLILQGSAEGLPKIIAIGSCMSRL